MAPEKARQEQELARKVLEQSRKQLAAELPQLIPALYLMELKAWEEDGPLQTDGQTIFYHPHSVLKAFRQSRRLPAKQLLHLVTHGLLGHFGKRGLAPPELFDPIADAKVHNVLTRMEQETHTALTVRADNRTRRFSDVCASRPLERCCQQVTASAKASQMAQAVAEELRMDDHSIWGRRPPAAVLLGGAFGQQDPWQAVAWNVAQALNIIGWGNAGGCLEREIQVAEDNDVSYEEIIRRFALPRERMITDPDSLDFAWYHLGMDLLGNVPLIEPHEVRDVQTADSLVVALDTSGSCDGEVMSRFLRETLNLLRDIHCSPDFPVRVIQCDAKIQQEALLYTDSEIPQDFIPRGFGGTDFRPVFHRVEELRNSGEQIRGLIYFSDGMGRFPDNPPEFETIFVVPEDMFWQGMKMPAWVTAVTLKENELEL